MRRSAPSTFHTILFLSAAKRSKSPGFPFIFATSASSSASVINLANDDLYVPSSLMHRLASPFAPQPFACSTSLSIFLRGIFACPSTLIPRTEPPFSRAPVNTPKPQSFTTSETSQSSIPKRVSGLSEPNLSIASCQGIRLNGISTSTLTTSLKRCFNSLSFTSITSSISTNESSISACVNSGCLSARRSSSRKHRAIWKYLS